MNESLLSTAECEPKACHQEFDLEIVCPAWCPGAERLIDAIPILADQGVTAIEVGVGHPNYFDHNDGHEIDTLLARLSVSGIRINSVHSPFGPAYDISSPEDDSHERGVDAVLQSIEFASLVQARYVIVHASDVLPEQEIRRLERARAVIGELSKVASDSGLMLALENLPPGYLGHTPEEIESLLDGADTRAIGVCFDSGHANLSGQFAEYADKLLPLSVTTHLHDNDGVEDLHLFPGEGQIDWHGFREAYQKSGSCAGIMLECMPPEGLMWGDAFHRLRTAFEN